MKLFVAVCLFLGALHSGHAQRAMDTVQLGEVVVRADHLHRYLPGGRQHVISTDTLAPQNMAQALDSRIPVYFIQYGAPGQLASINLRGLGASRTSVRWQGMEINSFTLGQTDFSELSINAGDEINIQFGGVGAMFGNGALGGTIDLQSKLAYDRGHSVRLNSSFGSFNSIGFNLNHRYSSARISSSTKVFRRHADNDFKYLLGNEYRRQKNAGYIHFGVLQDLEYQLNQYNKLSIHFWYNDFFREIQPNINNPTGDEVLKTKNTRVALKWKMNKGQWNGNLQTGFTDDYQLYDHSDLTRLNRWFASFDTEWAGLQAFTFRFGGNFNFLQPKVDTYQDNAKETRSELYAALVWEQVKNLKLGFSLRTPVANGQFKALSPLLSTSYLFYQSKGVQLTGDFQVGNSYKLPTLNQLYWMPGGNPELKPESSNNLEAGLGMIWDQQRLQWETNLRIFMHMVDNWIIWVPGGSEQNPDGEIVSFWYPDNIREVLSTGIEYQQTIDWQLPVKGLATTFTVQGTYIKSVNKKTLSPVDRSKDKQLPYTPRHLLNGSWTSTYKSWQLMVNTQYRSERFVETNNELPSLPAYILWNFSAGKSGRLGSLRWTLQAAVNNALDKSYEAFENRAMPGRNYQLNLNINYN